MSARRPTLSGLVVQCVSSRRFVPVFAVVVFAMLALSSPAFSLLTFPLDEQIAPTIGAFAGIGPGSVAVNDFNGDTYVADQGNGEVDVFNSSGDQLASLDSSTTPAGSFGGGPSGNFREYSISVAANNVTGQVYVVDPVDNVVDAFNSTGKYECQITGSSTPSATECNGVVGSATPAGGFTHPNGITVDQATGSVYVVDANNHAVDIFSAKGVYQRQISLASVPNPIIPEFMRGIAVDDFTGSVYVAGNATSIQGFGAEVPVVYEFNSSGGYSSILTGTNTPHGSKFNESGSFTSVAADNANGTVYITANAVTYAFDASDKYLAEFSKSDPRGVAVDQASGKVYLSVGTHIEVFGPGVQIPDVTTGPASEIKRESVTLNGTVDPDKAGAATCEFLWGTSTSFGNTTPCSVPVAEGSSPVAAHATLTGLQPNTTYYYRLQATNTNGTNAGEASQDRQFTTSGPAAIDDESASNVAAGSATFNATISVHNAPTTYYFQYGPSTAYGTDLPAAPGATLGSGEITTEVSQHVQTLLENTVYHYRVVTVSQLEISPGTFEVSETDGPDQTLTTQLVGGGLTLPDGRQWEMVTPPAKHGADLFAIGQVTDEGGVIQSSASGDAMTWVADSPTESTPEGYTNLLQGFSVRGPQGWSSKDIAVPHPKATGVSLGYGEEYRFFSEDLSLGVVQPFGSFIPSLSAEASEQTPYLRTDYAEGDAGVQCSNSCYKPLVTGAPGFANVPAGTVFGEEAEGHCESPDGGLLCGPHFVGATPDLSHVVLISVVALTPTPAPKGGLYEWAAGNLTLISRLPGSVGEAANAPELGAGLLARHAISDDGSRIFWSARGSLFMRDVPREETITISENAQFEDASADGSKVFFSGKMCEVKLNGTTGELECPVAGEDGQIVGLSEDGSWAYFVSNKVLAPGGVSGGNNLYASHEGTTRFIATITNEDASRTTGGDLTRLYARVSPDGHWLAFTSLSELTGYDTRDALTGRPDEEVYLYNAEADGGQGQLVCASCNPSGARPIGGEFGIEIEEEAEKVKATTLSAATIPGYTPYSENVGLYQSRYLSDSGRLFFNSNEALVPQDVNGTWDVYQYEPPGAGNCSSTSATFSERSSGCVGLISSGESAEESMFLDASQDGGDVFFLTTVKLSSEDRDSAIDIYDAHECTPGEPCFAAPPVQPPTCDTGDSCKAAPSPQPEVFGSPASATFAGVGNVVAPVSKPAAAPKALTRAQKLARALKVCKKKKKGKPRTTCVRQAKAKYGAKKSSRVNATKKDRG